MYLHPVLVYTKLVLLFTGVLVYFHGQEEENRGEPSVQGRSCPCEDPSLCERVKTTREPEVFIFSVSKQNWRQYDWSKVTTVVQFGYIDDDLMCFAHSKGARVLQKADFPVSNLTDSSDRHKWVEQQVASANDRYLDGINVDIEGEIDKDNNATRFGLTLLLQELVSSAKSLDPAVQVSADFAWSPSCIDKRCYDYKAMADILDVIFVMSYDERSQFNKPCIAWANSAFNTTEYGLKQYLKLGIPANKIVLGVPWYGYYYQCDSYDQVEQICHIKEVSFKGSPCSDAAGHQKAYRTIVGNYLPLSSGRKWNNESQTPFLEFKDSVSPSQVSQIWYDDVESLSLKYGLLSKLKLRGVGMWNADTLNYTDVKQINNMWGALP